jgi:homoserine kinase type II
VAVLTRIEAAEAAALLQAYGFGTLHSIEGIPAGSVNSNFALKAGGQRLFLRIYEEQALEGARGETRMLDRLAGAGVPTPCPCRRVDGELVSVVQGKPAALFPWVEGDMRCQAGVTPGHARAVGEALAKVHLAAQGEARGVGRFRYEDLSGRLARIAESKDPELAPKVPVLRASLDRAHADRDRSLPSGIVHGDLFRDNVLWTADDRIAALLDFESAFDGTYAFDLMVTMLAWCTGAALDASLARAMCEGYESVRSLAESERRGLWAEATFAALRFTITRITDYAMRTGAEGPRVVKDWKRFQKRYDDLIAMGPERLRETLGL